MEWAWDGAHELLVDQRVDLCPHAYAANLDTARLSTAVRTNWLSSRGATMGVPVEVYVGGYICMTAYQKHRWPDNAARERATEGVKRRE